MLRNAVGRRRVYVLHFMEKPVMKTDVSNVGLQKKALRNTRMANIHMAVCLYPKNI